MQDVLTIGKEDELQISITHEKTETWDILGVEVVGENTPAIFLNTEQRLQLIKFLIKTI